MILCIGDVDGVDYFVGYGNGFWVCVWVGGGFYVGSSVASVCDNAEEYFYRLPISMERVYP